MTRVLTSLSVLVAVSFTIGEVKAQAPAGGATAKGSLSAAGSEPPETRTSLSTASPPSLPAPAPVTRIKDHSKVVGSFGVGWFGISTVPIGTGNGAERGNVDTPVVGARYWYNDMIGVDAGLGVSLRTSSSSVDNNGTSVSNDGPSHLSFLLHGGVPIAFASGSHYIFEVVPELNVGYASGNAGASDTSLKGLLLELGARVGTEIQFGFMGLPELALEGSVGLSLRHNQWSAQQNGVKTSGSEWQFATTSFNQPWDFFKGVVAARYYF